MTFRELVDQTLSESFDESDRTYAKGWVNDRLGYLWNLEEWTFTKGHANVTVTGGSASVTGLPADFAVATSLQRDDGCYLHAYEEYREFARRYLGTGNATGGTPAAFTVQGGIITLGPTPFASSSAYLLTYEKAPTLLVNDSDVPAIPAEYHLALVHGAKAVGATLRSVLLADDHEKLFDQAVQGMTRKYLTEVRGASSQVPAYRPGGRRW